MPQIFTNLINKSIEDAAYNPALGSLSLESTSVRLLQMQPGTYVQIEGITWGAVNSLPDLNNGTLLVIRNEIFDPFFQYANNPIRQSKDIIFEDRVDSFDPVHNIDFSSPLKLNDAANYLIIVCGFITASITVQTLLTVRGKFIELETQSSWKVRK